MLKIFTLLSPKAANRLETLASLFGNRAIHYVQRTEPYGEGMGNMASVFDVAAYILERQGGMTAMKLHKLCYYSQAWSLVWDDDALFPEPIQAWAYGPVVPRLYFSHQGKVDVSSGDFEGDPKSLNTNQKETIDVVLASYGDKEAYWLSSLSHSEKPWREAREGLGFGERGSKEITHRAMRDYFKSLHSES